MVVRRCTKCGIVKELSEFHNKKGLPQGKRAQCKACVLAQNKEWQKAHPQKKADNERNWRARNPEKMREYLRKWKKRNHEKVAEWDRISRNTPRNRLDGRMKSAIRQALSGRKSGRTWESIVGYSLTDLMRHLESKFKDGMSWDNIGSWQIDHIIPRSAFSYETSRDIDFKICWSLKNLQPLWAEDNNAKNCKLDKPYQPSLRIAV